MRKQTYSDEELLKQLAQAMEKHGEDISYSFYEKVCGGKGLKPMKMRWGTWRGAKEAARKYIEHGTIVKGSPKETQANKQESKSCLSLSEEDLRRKHDTVFKVSEMADEIPRGQFLPEPDFVASLRLKGSYRAILERQQFERYRGKADGGLIYWGHPDSIQKLKNDRVLS